MRLNDCVCTRSGIDSPIDNNRFCTSTDSPSKSSARHNIDDLRPQKYRKCDDTFSPCVTPTSKTSICSNQPFNDCTSPQILYSVDDDSDISHNEVHWEIDDVVLDHSSFERLKPSEFLDDTILDFFLKFIQKYVLNAEQRRSIYFFNTFFFNKLNFSGTKEERYKIVQSWTKLLYNDRQSIWNFNYVFIPINLCNTHWWMVLVAFPKNSIVERNEPTSDSTSPVSSPVSIYGPKYPPSILVLNSWCADSAPDFIKTYIVEYFEMEFEHRGTDEMKSKFKIAGEEQWMFVPHGRVPHQHNGYDCGVFLIEYIRRFLENDKYLLQYLLVNGVQKAEKSSVTERKSHSLSYSGIFNRFFSRHTESPKRTPFRSSHLECSDEKKKRDGKIDEFLSTAVTKAWFHQKTVTYRRVVLSQILEYMRSQPKWMNSVCDKMELRRMFMSLPPQPPWLSKATRYSTPTTPCNLNSYDQTLSDTIGNLASSASPRRSISSGNMDTLLQCLKNKKLKASPPTGSLTRRQGSIGPTSPIQPSSFFGSVRFR